jgi:hypothetical protein
MKFRRSLSYVWIVQLHIPPWTLQFADNIIVLVQLNA